MGIGKIGVGAVASQQGDEFAASAGIENGFRQWCVAVGIPRINRRSRCEQGLGYGDRVRLGGEVEWRPAIVIGQISASAGGQKGLSLRQIAFASSVVQFGAAKTVDAGSFFSLWLFAGHGAKCFLCRLRCVGLAVCSIGKFEGKRFVAWQREPLAGLEAVRATHRFSSVGQVLPRTP